jgi:hypothetical protein
MAFFFIEFATSKRGKEYIHNKLTKAQSDDSDQSSRNGDSAERNNDLNERIVGEIEQMAGEARRQLELAYYKQVNSISVKNKEGLQNFNDLDKCYNWVKSECLNQSLTGHLMEFRGYETQKHLVRAVKVD